jgi:hypothetical protein
MTRDPDAVRLETGDIARFWQAVDEATPDTALETFQRVYFDQASPGLQDFIASRIESADKLLHTLEAKWSYYEAIRPNTLRVADLRETILGSFHRFADLLEDAEFPDVYFVIGRMTSGGTASRGSIQIGTEFFASDPSTPLESLTAWERAVVKSLEVLPGIVAHELAHFMHDQRFARANPMFVNPPMTLLRIVLIEGIAEYLGELTSNQVINTRIHAYGLEHEAALKARFKLEMDGTDWSGWLYQGDRAKNEPADLGYFIGYQIVKHWLERQPDFKRGVRALLEASDAKKLLEESGYLD